MLTLRSGDARVQVDLAAGGRISSFVVGGRELLVTSAMSDFGWGCYVMAPFAGRLRDGRFTHDGRTYQMPRNMPPHAIHGVVYDRPWRQVDASTLEAALGAPWPFAGRVVHRLDLEPEALTFRLELHADEPMPASVGWHPWFLRRPPLAAGPGGAGAGGQEHGAQEPGAQEHGGPEPGEVELDVEPGAMYERGADGIPTGRLVPPKARPWDDCFVDLRRPPVLRWPGFLELIVESDAPAWVIYDERAHAVCVEPETAAPDSINREPTIVTPDRPLVAGMTWRWRRSAR